MIMNPFTSPSYPCCRAIALMILLLIMTVGGSSVDKESSIPTGKGAWTGVTLSRLANVVDQGVRRAKGSKSGDSGSAADKGPKESDPTASEPNSLRDPETSAKEYTTVTANGLKMTLGGVYPLGLESRATWEGATSDFIEDDIMMLTKELAEVSVSFASQSPPYEEGTRHLETFGVRGTHPSRKLLGSRGMLVEITFDVFIEIASKIVDPNANRYVAHAFSSDTRKVAYMRKLLATGDTSFSNVGTVTLDANLPSSTSKKSAMEVGGIVGFAIFGVLCLSTIAYILYGRQSSASDDNGDREGKDQGSDKQARTETASASSDDEVAPKKTPKASRLRAASSGDEASLSSHYYDGNISVAWSMDTDIPQTPRVANSKLLGRMSRESSEDSLFMLDDGVEVQTPVIGPIHGAPMVVSPLLDDGAGPHVVTPPREKRLYEM